MKRNIAIFIIIAFFAASAFALESVQDIGFQIDVAGIVDMHYGLRYRLFSNTAANISLSDSDSIYVGSFQSLTSGNGVEGGSVYFDIMDYTFTNAAAGSTIKITVGGASIGGTGNSSNQVFRNRKLTFNTSNGTDSNGVSKTFSVSMVTDPTNSNFKTPVGTVSVIYPEPTEQQPEIDRTSVPVLLGSFTISWDASTNRADAGQYIANISVEVTRT